MEQRQIITMLNKDKRSNPDLEKVDKAEVLKKGKYVGN